MNLEDLPGIAFVGLALTLLLLERFSRWRRSSAPIENRWLTNIGLMLIGSIVLPMIFSADVRDVAGQMQGGPLRHLPPALEVVLVFALLDFWRYWEHRLFHEVPMLWRAHLVHHSDTAIDVTTGQRHHPLESIITTLLALILVFALGFSAQAFGFYLLVATLSALYTHANIDLPERLDRSLRGWLVTPAVHAIHHSSYQPETDSNYGSVLTIWDRLFGTYTDPADATIPSFGLEYFRRPQDTTLGPVLLQPFEYQKSGQQFAPAVHVTSAAHDPAVTMSPQWREALGYGAAGLALALLALWPTVLDLTRVWSQAEPYQYAWLVVPMFVYLVGWYHRDRILRLTPQPGYAGLPLILAAVALWTFAFLTSIRLGEHLAVVLVLQGIALGSLGWRTYRSLLPIMLLLFLMVPCGDILQPLLRNLTVKWIEWFTILAGLPHNIEGYIVYVGTHRYVVIDACSGLTLFTLAGFLGYSFGLMLFRSFAKVLALAALGAVLGILTNALRVCLIVAIDWQRGSQMDLAAHSGIQWLVLLASLAALLYLASRLNHESWPTPARGPTGTSGPALRTARIAPIVSGVLLLATAGLVQEINPAAPSGRNGSAGTGPLSLMANRYPDSHWLGQGQSRGSALAIPLDSVLDLVLMTPDDNTGQLNERLLQPPVDGAWRHTDTRHLRDCQASDCIDFVHKSWKQKSSDRERHAFYVYFIGDSVTDSKLNFKLSSGWNRLAGKAQASGLIGFTLLGELSATPGLARSFREMQGSLNTFNETTVGADGSSSGLDTDIGTDIQAVAVNPARR